MLPAEDAVQKVLARHLRRDIRSCLCGWDELGRSHVEHIAAVLRAADLLKDRED